MGLLKFFKKKKNANIKWEEASYIILQNENFDKVEALNDLYRTLDIGLLEAKAALETDEKISLPINGAELFLRLEEALAGHGAELQIYLRGKQLGNDKVQKTESADSQNSADKESLLSDSSKDISDEEDYPYYPDEENEPLIDYATGEIISPSKETE